MPGIFSVPLLFYDALVYFAGGYVVFPSKGDVQVALVISEVEINFATIVKHKAFAMSMTLLVFSITEAWISKGQYSKGFMSPASMFMYGSILIAVT